MVGLFPRRQDVGSQTRIRGELPQAVGAHPLQEGPVRQPAPPVGKREAVIAKLVNKSASA